MKHDAFKWIGPDSHARNGRHLIPGQTYATAEFPDEVVAEWIRTGNAKPVAAGTNEPRKDNE